MQIPSMPPLGPTPQGPNPRVHAAGSEAGAVAAGHDTEDRGGNGQEPWQLRRKKQATDPQGTESEGSEALDGSASAKPRADDGSGRGQRLDFDA
jgi:hypothetical protein